MSAPIPAHVITGSLGAGKTTVIARLLAAKPPQEDWVVLLNEFSDAGIDALTVASAARGAYDVRLVPGGCLCCAGEQDFRRNLQQLVTERRPHRILIEPSGLGHPAGIVEELLAYESAGALRLAGILALVDPRRLADGSLEPGSDAWAQVEIADALALSKADLATAEDHARFAAFAAALFPAKSWVGALDSAVVPWAALETDAPSSRAQPRAGRPPSHLAEHARAAVHGHPDSMARETPAAKGLRRAVRHLDHAAIRWVFPRAIAFSESRLLSAIAAASGQGASRGTAPAAKRPVRLKGVFRTGEDAWMLVQSEDTRIDVRPTSWRRDSRVEVLFAAGDAPRVDAWDAAWQQAQVA